MTRVQIIRSIVIAALLLTLAGVIGVRLWPNGDAERFDRAWAALEARTSTEPAVRWSSSGPARSSDPRRQLLEGTLLLREGNRPRLSTSLPGSIPARTCASRSCR